MTVRTRLEPAPSGSIHVGNARTALYCWLFARQNDGAFVLRIADTDRKRATEENYQAVLEDLSWLGLQWDEGPDVGGPFGPYRQSERFDRYREVAQSLVDEGHAYRCYCTAEELKERRRQAEAERRTPGYDRRCRYLSDAERARFESEGRPYAMRFAVPDERSVTVDDVVRGKVTTESAQIPDFVILRSDLSPTYMLAATVDDFDMAISHIIRGEDLMPATPRQILLREAMGASQLPVFAHLPLLVAPDGRPLSKRWGDVSVRAYRDAGFLPEALVNYLALLGWSYDDKTNIFSVDELTKYFSLERVGRSPATFDIPKLEWLNLHYIKSADTSTLADRLSPFCRAAGLDVDSPEGRATLEAVVPLISERLKRLDEAPPMIRFLFAPVRPDEKAERVLAGQDDYLQAAADALEGVESWTAEKIEGVLRELATARGLKPKQAFQPLRAAVTGTLVSPPLFESLELLGRDETIGRLRRT